jgi:hypothetical protein
MWIYKRMFNCHCPFIPSVFSVLTTWKCAFSRIDIPLKYTKSTLCVQICILIYLADPSGCGICGHSLPGIAGWNLAGDMDVCCECYELYARDLWVRQNTRKEECYREWCVRSTIESGVSECDRGVSIMRKTWPTRGCCAMEGRRMLLVSRTDSKHVRSME